MNCKKISQTVYGFVINLIIAFVICSNSYSDCPVPAVNGRQPFPSEMVPKFNEASKNELGTSAPAYPTIYKGWPNPVKVAPYVPAILLKAIGYYESEGCYPYQKIFGWYQFVADYGQTGPTLIGYTTGCGYGIMQITSPMVYVTEAQRLGIDRNKVASDYIYNIGTGAVVLIDKWNMPSIPAVGENDPEIIEDWYFAVWAYNRATIDNNPNNSIYDQNRPRYDGTQTNKEYQYPYQEKIWGRAANSPGTQFWESVPLSLPDRNLIGNWPNTSLSRIPCPLPLHREGTITPPVTSGIYTMDFEDGTDGDVIRSRIPGLTFTTTQGYDWIYADIRTGKYNVRPYKNSDYECNGNFCAWLGENQGVGRIDFTGATAKNVSFAYSSQEIMYLEAYDPNGNLIDSDSGPGNLQTGRLDRLSVTGANISYILVHDEGNFWAVDDLIVEDLLRETTAQFLPQDFERALEILNTINIGLPQQTEFANSTPHIIKIILNWGGSEMKLEVYRPDGTSYGQWQSSNPPIIVNIPNAATGKWKFVTTAKNIPYNDYPFALVVGTKQIPIASKLSNKTVYAYPNPFNPDTRVINIRYSLSKDANVTIEIYDANSGLITSLIKKQPKEKAVEYSESWDGRNGRGDIVANGVYFYLITTTNDEKAVGKIAVLR